MRLSTRSLEPLAPHRLCHNRGPSALAHGRASNAEPHKRR